MLDLEAAKRRSYDWPQRVIKELIVEVERLRKENHRMAEEIERFEAMVGFDGYSPENTPRTDTKR